MDLREKRDCGGRGKDKKVTVSTAHVGDGEKCSTVGPRVCGGSGEAGLMGRGRLEQSTCRASRLGPDSSSWASHSHQGTSLG